MSLTSIASWIGKAFGLARRSSHDQPGGNRGIMSFVPNFGAVAGVRVNEETALTYSAVYACVSVITANIAMMPWRVHKHSGASRLAANKHPVDRLLHVAPNPEMSAFQFRETLEAHALLWGNGYAEIERNVAGQPIALWPITPDRVRPTRDERGRIVYRVRGSGGGDAEIPARDMFHLRGLGFDGLVGYSVIRMAARTVALGIAMDEGAAGFFANDATPGGVLTSPVELDEEAQRRLVESFESRHRSPGKRGRVAVLQGGLDWKQTGIPSKDAQFLESRQWQPYEVCRWFQVPPHKINVLDRSTFSNIEEENRSFVPSSLMPWAVRLEGEAAMKLFQSPSFYSKINFNSLLRGNVDARTNYYNSMLDRGVLSINEVREKEDMESIGPDGDKRFVPLNMQALDAAGESEPVQEPEPPTPDEDDDENKPPDLSPLSPIIGEFCLRSSRREMHRIADMIKRQGDDQEAFAESLDSFVKQHRDWMRESALPLISSAASLFGLDESCQLLESLTAWLDQHCVCLLEANWQEPFDWECHCDMMTGSLERIIKDAACASQLA